MRTTPGAPAPPTRRQEPQEDPASFDSAQDRLHRAVAPAREARPKKRHPELVEGPLTTVGSGGAERVAQVTGSAPLPPMKKLEVLRQAQDDGVLRRRSARSFPLHRAKRLSLHL